MCPLGRYAGNRHRSHCNGEPARGTALAVAGKTLVAMKAFYGRPRYRLTQSVVRFFTGEGVLYEQLRELWKRLA